MGVNFIDVYYRTGLYPRRNRRSYPGTETAGDVDAIGAGVTGFRIGDRVASGMGLGGYAEERNMPAAMRREAARLDLLRDGGGDDAEGPHGAIPAAAHLQGASRRHDPDPCRGRRRRPDRVPVGQAPGRDGDRHRRRQGQGRLAKANGCDHVILYREEDWVARVAKITKGEKCHVVYDGVGKATFPGSLDCLRPFGLFASFGNASGPVENFSLLALSQRGSLFATRPTLGTHVAQRANLVKMAKDLFSVVASGAVKIPVHSKMKLKDAAEAHRQLEARATTGATVLLP